MKKLLLLVAAFAATTACSNFDEEILAPQTEGEGIHAVLNIATNSNNDTRVSVDTSDSNIWHVNWKESDDVMLYPTNQEYFGSVQMIISEDGYDKDMSTFESVYDTSMGTGSLQANTTYRVVHPFKATSLIKDSNYTFDLSLQDEGLHNTYMVSAENVETTNATNLYTTSDLSMAHVGAMIDLRVNFSNLAKDLTLTSVKVFDVPVTQTVDLAELDVNNSNFYGEQTNGDIILTAGKIAIAKDANEPTYLKFNIFPFSTEGMSFKFYFHDSEGVEYVLEKSSTFNATFKRATFNTVNLNCDMSEVKELGKPIEIKAVKAAGNYIGMNVIVNSDVCDGYLFNYAYPEDYVALDEREDEKDEGLQDPDGNGSTGLTSYGYESAFACNTSGWTPASIELLEDDCEYKVGIVAYKLVSGKRQMIGEPVEYTLTTTSRQTAFGTSDATVDVTLDKLDYTSITATITGNNNFAYYRGYAPKGEIDALGGSNTAAKIEEWLNTERDLGLGGITWFDENINAPKHLFESKYMNNEVVAKESITEQFTTNLTPDTDYYFFTFAIDQDGIGAIISKEFSTKAIVENNSLTTSVEVSPIATSASAKFTFGGASKVMYYNISEAYTDPEHDSYLAEDVIYASLVAGKYSSCINESFAVNFRNLTNGTNYILYYVGIDANGAATKLKKAEYTCATPTFNSNAALTLSVADTKPYETTGWPAEKGIEVTLNIEKLNAEKYIYGLFNGNQLAGLEGADLGVYLLSNNSTTTDAESVALRFPDAKGMKAVFIPVDADGKYGAPFTYAYSPNTYDETITATVDIIGKPVIESNPFAGDTATFSLEVTYGEKAVSYIYAPISKGTISIDFDDAQAVGDYVIANYVEVTGDVSTTIADISLTAMPETCVGIVPIDADGNYGTAITYKYGAWLSDLYSSEATVTLSFNAYDIVPLESSHRGYLQRNILAH